MGDIMTGKMGVHHPRHLVTGTPQVHERLARRRIQIGKLLGCLDEAFIAGDFFENEALHSGD